MLSLTSGTVSPHADSLDSGKHSTCPRFLVTDSLPFVPDSGVGRDRDREQLVEYLGERLRTAMTSGDPMGMLETAVSALARDLAEVLTLSRNAWAVVDVVAVGVLVDVHWVRYQLLPEGQDQD